MKKQRPIGFFMKRCKRATSYRQHGDGREWQGQGRSACRGLQHTHYGAERGGLSGERIYMVSATMLPNGYAE